MEPIDTDFEYVASKSRETDPRKRFNWMYIIPILGLLWLLYLTLAVIFQWPVTGVVDPVMSIMLVVFFVFVGLLFWALAPRAKRG
jgi:fatty acid desaturase